jgi:hypothetical protein
MIGWEFTHHPGFMEIKGNSPGFSSYLSRFTAADELVCVTLLTNKEGVDLTVLAREIADAYKTGLGPDVDQHHIVAQESKFDTAETVARIKALLAQEKVPLFSVVDHSDNATRAGTSTSPHHGALIRQSQSWHEADATEPSDRPRSTPASVGLAGRTRAHMDRISAIGRTSRSLRHQGSSHRRRHDRIYGSPGRASCQCLRVLTQKKEIDAMSETSNNLSRRSALRFLGVAAGAVVALRVAPATCGQHAGEFE